MIRFARFTRSFAGLALALLVLFVAVPAAPMAAQPADTPVAPFDWQLNVGGSSADQAVQTNFFMPRQVWVHVNDKVTWTWKSGEFHTVTFLSGQPPSFPGVPFAPAGGTPFEAVYNGSGQISSGAHLAVSGTPFPTGPYTVQFTKAGDFQFNCMFHSTMTGVVHVRRAGQRLPHEQGWYTQQANAQAARYLKQGLELQAEFAQDAAAGPQNAVSAGYGELEDTGSFAILRFERTETWVKVNDTVTFSVLDPETPHTATFGVEPADPDTRVPASGLAVIGPGFDKTADTVSSGVLSQQSFAPLFTFRGPTFQVKFTAAGDYDYICALHDFLGMQATIHVR